MIILYSTALLLGAALLFTVQPLFARLALPLLGGSPAVWNTAMVFFQCALLAGYAYAHGLGGRDRRTFPWLHVALLALAGALLPIRIPAGWTPPGSGDPTGWLMALLAVGVGAPFLLVSTTGPLLQRWFAATGHARAADPYFLYAASNAGSLAGLLAYPFLIEPRLSLADQTRAWSAGYAALVVLTAACAFTVSRGPATAPVAAAQAGPPVPWPRRLRWVLLAFVPSSLMLGSTAHLSTDIAAIPLLWVVPLALYLLSFVVAFSPRAQPLVALAARIVPFAIVGLVLVIQSRANQPLAMIVTLHLAALLSAAITCHGALAATRPDSARLTEFYLWIAVGGALGGVFNALVAPVLFRSIVEYKVALVLACACLPAATAGGTKSRILDGVVPLVLGALFAGLAALTPRVEPDLRSIAAVGLLAVTSIAVFTLRRRPLRFALAVAAVFVARPWGLLEPGRQVHVERSFFGVHRVLDAKEPTGEFHVLMHGTTVHGMQRMAPARCREPLGYYHGLGPASQVMAFGPASGRRIGITGLGTGALAAYARPGDHWTFYEIDPAVARIAADPALFCFLASMPVPHSIRLGDARLSLAADTTVRFDLLVLDAYSSDAIPVHLLTREAVGLYVSRLAPHGVLALHVSNRNFDLVPVVEGLARDAGLTCRIRTDRALGEVETRAGAAPSEWAVLARSESDLDPLRADPRWRAPARASRLPLWTDDYSSLVSVLR